MTENPKVGDTPPPGTKCAQPMSRGKCAFAAKTYEIPRDYSGAPIANPAKWSDRERVDEADAKPFPLCGMHAAMYQKRKAEADRQEADRLGRQKERAALTKRLTIATNLSSMLSEDLGGVSFSPSDDGRALVLSIDGAKILRERIAELPAQARRSLALRD